MSDASGRVEVALPLPIHRTFTYRVDGEPPPAGSRVLVPFRRSDRIGWVVGPGDEGPIKGLRPILSVLDRRPSVTPDLLELCRWMADYYVSPLGITIRAALPAVLSDVARDYVTWTGGGSALQGLRPRERKLAEHLLTHEGPQRVATLRRTLGMGSIWPELRALEAHGLLDHEAVPPAEPSVRTRRVARVVRTVGTLEEKGLLEMVDEEEIRDPFAAQPPPVPQNLVPTPAQRAALDRLVAACDEGEAAPFLLQGITGSGKTLVYIELLREVLGRGKSAIVLVPEISLTPQTVSRFRAHFGDEVAVLHSGLSDGERYDAWRLLRDGERRVAVGARSALFAPLERLGAVVVDEEHDGSYKQSEAPRYQARDLAVMRARAHGAVCVLGSATPSLESRYNVDAGKFERLELPERAGGATLPAVGVVDLRAARKKGPGRESGAPAQSVFSPELTDAIRARLRRREQVILLLNRRGYSSFVQCRSCGEVEQCENCSISLTFHRVTRRIVCHHCRFEAPAPSRCPRCGSDDLSFRGVGTEQVERVATELFPEARIARMDVDTTSGKWSHQRILERVERHEVDILLGTQMIAKGLDFPNVTLVGVAIGGEVLIQTSMPEHYAVRAAVAHDYESFVAREIEERRHPRYPPHVRMANVVLSSPDQALAAEATEAAVAWLKRRLARPEYAGVELVGPAPAPIERLHGRWRWHFLLRAESPRALGAAARAVVTRFRLPAGDVRLALDRDPVALL
ncbi:MAG: primosomal protein N' [Thioalkalivibrio sp.]|nr:primosomal protein N' [Thioalkalivibrio sp.]